MLAEPFHNLGVGFFRASEVTAVSVLIELFAGLTIPKAAGIGADFVGKNNGAVR